MRLAKSLGLAFVWLGWLVSSATAQVVATAGASAPGAASLGLDRAWTTKVTLDSTRGYVVGLVLHKGVLFVSTSQGIVQAIDAEHGASYWTVKVGKPEHVTLPPAANDRYVVVTNGSNLFTLDRRSGRVDSQRTLKAGSACAGPAMSETHCYVPMFTGAIEMFRLKNAAEIDKEPVIFFAAGASLAPPLVRGSRMYWTSKNGFIYGDGTAKSDDRFRFQTAGQVLGAAAVIPQEKNTAIVYGGSHDGAVYAIHDPDGAQLWQYQTGAPVVHAPVVIGDAVYAVNDNDRLVRLHYKTGVAEWQAEGAQRILAASPARLYVSDRTGNLLMLDTGTGGLLGATFIGTNTVPFFNDQNDRIYIVSTSGLIQCLHERALLDPVAHLPPSTSDQPAPMPMGTETPAAGAAVPSPFAQE